MSTAKFGGSSSRNFCSIFHIRTIQTTLVLSALIWPSTAQLVPLWLTNWAISFLLPAKLQWLPSHSQALLLLATKAGEASPWSPSPTPVLWDVGNHSPQLSSLWICGFVQVTCLPSCSFDSRGRSSLSHKAQVHYPQLFCSTHFPPVMDSLDTGTESSPRPENCHYFSPKPVSLQAGTQPDRTHA